jgi:hypothetical protein
MDAGAPSLCRERGGNSEEKRFGLHRRHLDGAGSHAPLKLFGMPPQMRGHSVHGHGARARRPGQEQSEEEQDDTRNHLEQDRGASPHGADNHMLDYTSESDPLELISIRLHLHPRAAATWMSQPTTAASFFFDGAGGDGMPLLLHRSNSGLFRSP